MIFKNKTDFDSYVRDRFDSVEESLYLIMRTGSSVTELLESDYNITAAFIVPVLGQEAEVQLFGMCITEDDKYIEVYDSYSEKQLIYVLMHRRMKDSDVTD